MNIIISIIIITITYCYHHYLHGGKAGSCFRKHRQVEVLSAAETPGRFPQLHLDPNESPGFKNLEFDDWFRV